MYGHADLSTRHVGAATGAHTTAPDASASASSGTQRPYGAFRQSSPAMC
jgi:hypothetical protein